MTRREWIAAMLAAPMSRSIVRADGCVWGKPEWLPDPILVPDQPYEQQCAMPFSDGCWWDEARQRYRLWYMAGYRAETALAESRDGYTWTKLGLIDSRARDSSTVWQLADGAYIRAVYYLAEPDALTIEWSCDGVTWKRAGRTRDCGERSTIYRRGENWILSARENDGQGRLRRYYIADDILGPWRPVPSSLIVSDDSDGVGSQLYNVDAAPFGDGYLALSAMWTGDRADGPKRNNLAVFYGDDGLSWRRGPRRWIEAEENDPQSWRFGNIQSCGGCYVKLKDGKLGIYVSARSGAGNQQRCVTGMLTLSPSAVCTA